MCVYVCECLSLVLDWKMTGSVHSVLSSSMEEYVWVSLHVRSCRYQGGKEVWVRMSLP